MSQDQLRRLIEEVIEEGRSCGHAPNIEGATRGDTCVCSCGWKSNTYWDGREWAYDEWIEHFKKIIQRSLSLFDENIGREIAQREAPGWQFISATSDGSDSIIVEVESAGQKRVLGISVSKREAIWLQG